MCGMRTPCPRISLALLFAGMLISSCFRTDIRAGSFDRGPEMCAPRSGHTGTLLPDGKVLVAGGETVLHESPIASAELYDPFTRQWTMTGPMRSARVSHTATLLPNGKVLVAGGYGDTASGTLGTAELYDPATGFWVDTGSMIAARDCHTATLLPNGKVLVAGGYGPDGVGGCGSLTSAELYDPENGTWASTGSLHAGRFYHTATLLPNGKVLIAAGVDFLEVSSAELYDPADGTWTETGALPAAPGVGAAVLLPTGKVLVAKGYLWNVWNTPVGYYKPVGQLYDYESGTWTATSPLNIGGSYHTATLLGDGTVLVAGGDCYEDVEIYHPDSCAWTWSVYDPDPCSWLVDTLNTGRRDHTATRLLTGRVIIAGGCGREEILSSTEIYTPTTGFEYPIGVVDSAKLPGGSFQLTFSSISGALFGVVATGDVSLPVQQWSVMGMATEIERGRFRFTDAGATNVSTRFYRLVSIP